MASALAAFPIDHSAQNLVRLTLLDFLPGAPVSTRAAITGIRSRDPECHASDDDLVNLIIAASAGHSMTIDFDHREE